MAVFRAIHIAISYLFWAVAGLAIFILLFQTAIFSHIDILFYRGLAQAALTSVVLAVLITLLHQFRPGSILVPGYSLRDVFAVCVAMLGLNVTFLIVFPVTIDRSVTVFLLGQMESTPNHPWTEQELEQKLISKYITEYRAVQRRLEEQRRTGNVTENAGGYTLTPQGKEFLDFSRRVAAAFHTDAKFLNANENSGIKK